MGGTSEGHLLPLENTDAEEEGKEEFVLLKERAADVLVDTVGEVLVEAVEAARQLTARLTALDRLPHTAHSGTYTAQSISARILVCTILRISATPMLGDRPSYDFRKSAYILFYFPAENNPSFCRHKIQHSELTRF